ncbi:MAG: hypothetical protein EXS51_00170 [Candidatus Taylorbacteria bacterium]|nr:hypothetical protein [Candidatus Taylorbacteria bacterium]
MKLPEEIPNSAATTPPVEQSTDEPEVTLTRQHVRGYSKLHSKEGRDMVAEEVRGLRADYFSRIRQLEDSLALVSSQLAEKKANYAEVGAAIPELERELAALEGSSLNSFLSLLNLNRKERSLKREAILQEGTFKELEISTGRLTETLEALKRERDSRTELEQAKDRVKGFYAEQKAELKTEVLKLFVEQAKIRDINRISQEHDVMFVHGIHPKFVPKQNSLMHNQADWQTKLKVTLAFAPTVSSSTLSDGDGPDAMWARMGVILNGGQAESASRDDNATQARGFEKRSESQTKMTDYEIQSAISGRYMRGAKRYNEFSVATPKIAGFYFSREETKNSPPDLVPLSEITETCTALRLPLYEIVKGQPYRTHVDEKTGEIIRGEPVQKGDLVKSSWKISEIERSQIIEELLDTSPFKIIPEEGENLDARAHGVETYLNLNLKKLPQKKLAGVKSTTTSGIYTYSIDSTVNALTRSCDVPFRKKELTNEERLAWQIHDDLPRNLYRRNMDEWHPNSSTYITERLSINTSSYFNTETYLQALDKEVSVFLELKGQFSLFSSLTAEKKEQKKEWLGKQLAFHLRGFGETAAEFGETKLAEKAKSIADRLGTENEYQDVLKRRINTRGFFRLTKEDIKYLQEGTVIEV